MSLLTLLILAGCGGSPSEKVQTVRGEGYRFEAPADWHQVPAKHLVQDPQGAGLAEVLTYQTVKRYEPDRFTEAAAELDRNAAQLARQQKGGKLVKKLTTQVAGRKVRWYQIDFGPGRTEELAFVFEGKTEYFLLCRRLTSDADTDCKNFFSSFRLQ